MKDFYILSKVNLQNCDCLCRRERVNFLPQINLISHFCLIIKTFFFNNIFHEDLQDKKSKLLSKDSGCLLTKSAQEVWTAYEDLLSGQITVENFRLVQKNKDNFFKIIKIIIERDKKDVVFRETRTTQLINIRDKEISHFERILCDVRIFTDMCHHFEGIIINYRTIHRFQIEKHYHITGTRKPLHLWSQWTYLY